MLRKYEANRQKLHDACMTIFTNSQYILRHAACWLHVLPHTACWLHVLPHTDLFLSKHEYESYSMNNTAICGTYYLFV
jgi:hypothetical protein